MPCLLARSLAARAVSRRIISSVICVGGFFDRNILLTVLTARLIMNPPRCRCTSVAHRRDLVGGRCSGRRSRALLLSAVDRNLECLTDLSHPHTAQRADPFDQHRSRHRLDRVQVGGTPATDRVFAGVENDLTRQTSDRRRTRCNERSTQPRDGYVTRQDHDWPSTDFRKFAPPELTSGRQRAHVADAAFRNEARSPQSSSTSRGSASYAAA